MSDTQANETLATPTETVSGPAGGRSRRRFLLFGGATIAVAAVAAGAFALLGGGDDAGGKQTLCGLERADGTPLGTLLPKGRPGAEERKANAGEHRVSCVISVDGEEALTVLLRGVDPDEPAADGGASTKDLIGRGVGASGPGAAVVEYCADNHSRAVMVSVIADTSIMLRPNADRDSLTKAVGAVTAKVAAEQQRDVCS